MFRKSMRLVWRKLGPARATAMLHSRFLLIPFLAVTLLFLYSGCAVTQNSIGKENSNSVFHAYGYAGLYWSSPTEVRAFDSRNGVDAVVVPYANPEGFRSELSPDGSRLALGYRTECALVVALVDCKTLAFEIIHSRSTPDRCSTDGCVNLAWSPDGNKLFFNYTLCSRGVQKNEGSYQYTIDDEVLSPFRVRNGSAVEACLVTGYVVFSDKSAYYLVNAATGIQEFSLRGVTKAEFSPDGRKVLYYRNVQKLSYAGRPTSPGTLFVADFDGRNEREVVSSNLQPEGPSWLYDSQRIIVEQRASDALLQQPQDGGRVIGTYDTRTDDFSLATIRNESGTSTEHPLLSPDRKKLLYMQSAPFVNGLDRTQAWPVAGVYVQDLCSRTTVTLSLRNEEFKESDGSILRNGFRWMDNNDLVSLNDSHARHFDLTDNSDANLTNYPVCLWKVQQTKVNPDALVAQRTSSSRKSSGKATVSGAAESLAIFSLAAK